jgi:hypothetical protein
MQQSPSWESDSMTASQKIPKLNGTSKFKIISKRAQTWPCSESDPIHSRPCHCFSLKANFIPSHQCTDLPSCLFASGFLIKTLYISLLYHMCHTLNSAYLPCVYGMLCCTHGLHRDTKHHHTILANYQLQCFPNIFVCKPLLGSKNKQGSSHPCSNIYGVWMTGIQN